MLIARQKTDATNVPGIRTWNSLGRFVKRGEKGILILAPMLEDFLEHPFFLNRHRQAPLLKERELFLSHLQQQGTSRKALRNLSGEMLPVMRLLKLTEMRDVSLEEIQRAALCWAREQRTNPKAQSYGNSASFFVYAAKKWLRFHGRLKLPIAPPMRFADQLNYFARYMTEEQGLSPYSVRSHCAKTSKFLEWFGERHRLLTRTRIEDVDEFLAMKGAGGWSRRSVSVAAQALRAFFRYAETRGWCATGFAKGIQGPRIYKYEGVPEGPSWEQVRRLTRGLIGDVEFALMKKNAVVINVGRGPTIDERAMIKALSQRRIRGAALDVFDQEPLPQGHPFYSLENVLLSPHCADHTPDWLDNAMRFFLEQLERFRRGERLFNFVDKALGY
jgi:hypothetical protein